MVHGVRLKIVWTELAIGWLIRLTDVFQASEAQGAEIAAIHNYYRHTTEVMQQGLSRQAVYR